MVEPAAGIALTESDGQATEEVLGGIVQTTHVHCIMSIPCSKR